jgi:hypothetical protein
MVMLDHQVLRVPGDEDIDLTGFHVYHQVNDWLSLGAGVYAPLLKGQYGGFTAFDVGAHLQQRLTDRIFVTAGLAGGGGGGGRSIEQSKVLSGTGGFYKAYAGLGYDFGPVAVGVNLAKMKFTHSAIDSTQANVFLEIPYSYLVAPFSRHGQGLSASDARLAAEDSGENMLTLVLDNFKQIRPEGSFKGTLGVADLQYAHFLAPNTYWYAGLGVGYYGLPLYNQVLGGVGQRLRVSPRVNLYAQLGVGSGGYAPEKIDTDSGLLVYPKVSAEYALTPSLGLSLSAGYLAAPKGSSRNVTYGLALTHHLRSGAAAAGWGDAGAATTRPSASACSSRPSSMCATATRTAATCRWWAPRWTPCSTTAGSSRCRRPWPTAPTWATPATANCWPAWACRPARSPANACRPSAS